MKIRAVVSKLFHADRRMDAQILRKSIAVAFREFSNFHNVNHFWAYVYSRFILRVNVNSSLEVSRDILDTSCIFYTTTSMQISYR